VGDISLPVFVRRLLPALLVAAFGLSIVAVPVGAVQSPSNPETHLLALVNKARAGLGVRPLRWDNRLADVAQWRSNSMATSGDFGHLAMSTLEAKVDAEGITWYWLGENIAKNNYSTAMKSADAAMAGWRNSSTHWKLLTSSKYNYVAIGMAKASNGWYYWTANFIQGPDRTAPTRKMTGTSLGSVSSGYRTAKITWTGHDVKLSVLTSGLRDFRLQKRIGSGSWKTVTSWTTATAKKFSLKSGKTYRFRVKARDKAGNRSSWSAAIVVKP
jgi:uncharacterized protein YkwD